MLSDLLLAARGQGLAALLTWVLATAAVILLTRRFLRNRKRRPRRQSCRGHSAASTKVSRKREDRPLSQPDFLTTQINEGMACYQKRQFAKAEAVFRRIVQNPGYSTQTSQQKAAVHRMLALSCAEQGKLDDAIRYCSRGIELCDETKSWANRDSVRLRQDLARLHSLRGDLDKAEATLREILSTLEKRLGRPDASIVVTLYQLAQVQQSRGDLENAERHLQESLLCYDNASWRSDKDYIAILEALAQVQINRKNVDAGTATLTRAIEIQERSLGPDDPAIVQSLLRLWQAYMDDIRYLKAEKVCRRALEIEERRVGPDHPAVGVVLAHLIVACERQGRSAEAEDLTGRQLTIFSRAPAGEERDLLAVRLCQYAAYLRSQNRTINADRVESIILECSPAYATWLRPERSWPDWRWN